MLNSSSEDFRKLERDYRSVQIQLENADISAKKFKQRAESKDVEIQQLTRETNSLRIEMENMHDSNNDLTQVPLCCCNDLRVLTALTSLEIEQVCSQTFRIWTICHRPEGKAEADWTTEPDFWVSKRETIIWAQWQAR